MFSLSRLPPVTCPPDSSSNLVERVQDIYLAVVESEECMERVACEVGGIAADAGVNKGMTK